MKLLRKIETLEKRDAIAPSQLEILKKEKQQLIQRTDKLGIRGRKIWDNRDWEKSLVVAIDEYLFHFLELVLAGERARVTFSKLITTKARLAEFTLKRCKKEDLLLNQIEESFIKDYTKHIIVHHRNAHDTIWKNVQIIKEITERAFVKGWIPTNVFGLFTWSYKEPDDKTWPTMDGCLFYRWQNCVNGFNMPLRVNTTARKSLELHPATMWKNIVFSENSLPITLDENYYVTSVKVK